MSKPNLERSLQSSYYKEIMLNFPSNTQTSLSSLVPPQGGGGADHATAASPFSFVYFPPPWTPLFDDQAGAQQLQLPFQNHIDLSTVEAHARPDDHVDGEWIRAARKKRDRHSKIVTCSRPRHRRMRLSIDVARQFFDLQERLGFERASKTVEWLLVRARSDIKKLHKERCGTNTSVSSPNSECEAVSTLSADESKPLEKGKRKYRRRSLAQPPRRSAFAPEAKRARKMARMKARQRTVEKKLALGIPVDPDLLVMSIQQHCQDQNLNLMEVPQDEYHCFHGLIPEEENDRTTSTAMIHEDLFCAFLNADKQHCDQSLLYSIISNDSLQISTALPQEQHQSSEYQFLLKAWNQATMS